MTDRNAWESRRGRAIFGCAAGACAGVPAAFLTLALTCHVAMGTDCQDGYIGMMVLAPFSMLVCAAAGAELAAKSARMAAAVVIGAAGAVVGYGVGVHAMGQGMSLAVPMLVPVILAGAGAVAGCWLADRPSWRRGPSPENLADV